MARPDRDPATPPPPESSPPPVRFHPPPGTVPRGGGRGVWIAIAFFIMLIIVGLLFWSGVL